MQTNMKKQSVSKETNSALRQKTLIPHADLPDIQMMGLKPLGAKAATHGDPEKLDLANRLIDGTANVMDYGHLDKLPY